MNKYEVGRRIIDIYNLFLNTMKAELYLQHEEELDELYELLQLDGEVTESLLELYKEILILNQQVAQLLQQLQSTNRKMQQVSYNSYVQATDSYFMDKKW